jgi:hypothetical protein
MALKIRPSTPDGFLVKAIIMSCRKLAPGALCQSTKDFYLRDI